MKFDDSLWKAILEDLFADFLRFFFSNADAIFDIKKGFEYLDKENDSKFDNKIDSFTQKSRHMGIIETIKERETQKILERGIEKGRAEGKTEVVRNLITKLGLPDAQAAEVAEVPIAFVKKVRASLKKKQ